MVTFVANIGVNVSLLPQLAQVVAAWGTPASIVFNEINTTHFTATSAPYTMDVTGSSFTYGFSDEKPLTGFVTGFSVLQGANTLYSVSNIPNVAVNFLQSVPLMAPINLFIGADTQNGSPFADKLFGYAANDALNGNGGNDTLTGGLGKDTQNGGTGRDFFDLNAANESTPGSFDIINAFSVAQDDRIDLRTIDATPGGANNAFLFAGAQSFAAFNATHVGGAVRDAGAFIEIDIGGNNTVDMKIQVAIVAVAGDFFL